MNWMKSKMKFGFLAALVMLFPSCAWMPWVKGKDESLNVSALYDPHAVTLLDGVTYQFKEGKLDGRGQKFHSEFSYQQALVIGK